MYLKVLSYFPPLVLSRQVLMLAIIFLDCIPHWTFDVFHYVNPVSTLPTVTLWRTYPTIVLV